MAKFKRARKVIHGWQKSLPNLAKVIAKTELTIQLMDFIEEIRDLTIQEWNFKNTLVQHLQSLLSKQCAYWKQRGQIKWVTLGDAGTKFFHAHATSKHRLNSISSLSCDNGMVAFSHKDKEEVLFQAFKNRLGTSQPTSMVFNLSELIQSARNLSALEVPFSRSEIDQIIKNLPSNKSPGPDGFNTDFVKKCWPVIASDFYEVCDKFYEGSICLESINGSYVTLIPKISSPTSVGDYRPISLLNTSMKILTKILANRLQLVITSLIHQNQYGFIQGRTIQDCLAWAFEYISICHKSGKEMVILKLDFEKAFDRLEHAAIIDILRHKGFGDRWLHWISLILDSGTSQILLNGVPGRRFHCKHGVRQGDPLSPLLFVLAADLLQSIINKAKDCDILKLPIPLSCGSDFPIIQYADDTILILEACPRQLFFLKAMLNSFADSTGLHVNYNKSNIYPINVSEQKMAMLANTFHCKVGSLPFTYLGLPLGLKRPNLEAFLPLIQKTERRLASTSIFLSQAGRLQMVNAVFSSLPTFYMCTLKLPKTVIKQIDKLRRHCLWRGADINAKKLPQVAWKSVCRPKSQGGSWSHQH
jgi:hypothetical protein